MKKKFVALGKIMLDPSDTTGVHITGESGG